MNKPPIDLGVGRATWLTAKFVLIQLGLFIAIGVAVGVGQAIAKLQHQPVDTAFVTPPAAIIVVNTIAWFAVMFFELRRQRQPWRAVVTWRCGVARLLPPILMLAVGAVVVVSELDNWVGAMAPAPAWIRASFVPLHDLIGHPISAPLALVVMAPFTEELLCRGLILRGLLGRVGPARAIGVSAMLFTLMHLNPWQSASALVLGILLGWVFWRTRSLALCVAWHAFNNGVSLLAPGLPFTVAGFNAEHPVAAVVHQPWWFNLGGVLLIAAGAVLFHRSTPRPVEDELVIGEEPPPLPGVLPPPLPAAIPVGPTESGANSSE